MDDSNIPTSKFIFIFICNNEVILDQDENLPSESVHDSESGTYSWNEMAINITKKVFNCFTVTHLLALRSSILALACFICFCAAAKADETSSYLTKYT